jgi:hypothetical protein
VWVHAIARKKASLMFPALISPVNTLAANPPRTASVRGTAHGTGAIWCPFRGPIPSHLLSDNDVAQEGWPLAGQWRRNGRGGQAAGLEATPELLASGSGVPDAALARRRMITAELRPGRGG